MIDISQFCPPNVTVSQIWLRGGFSHCFYDSLISSLSITFILIFGTIQLWFYKKYATALQLYVLPYSQLFGLQMVLIGVMPIISLVRLLLDAFILPPRIIYAYELLPVSASIISWTFVGILVLRERNFMLPTVPRKQHGLVLLMFWTWVFGTENLMFLNIRSPSWFFGLKKSADIIHLSLFSFEYCVAGGIFLLGLKAPGIPSIRNSENYSRIFPDSGENGGENERISNGSPFRNIGAKIRMLAPYIWPTKSVKLQIYVILSFATLILGRATNVYVPLYSKKIVDSMTIGVNSSHIGETLFSSGTSPLHLVFRWDYILIYVGLKIVQGGGAGGSGLLSSIRSFLWISVEQYTTREVEVSFFEHLHNLSLRWHLQRKTGEVLRAMDRGTESINSILNYLVFSILPTIADILIAIIYLSAFFNLYFGLIVFITMVVYLVATFAITEWRTKFRRSMNKADNEQKQRAVDSLLNFETVKYYANESYETERYSSAIGRYQTEEWKVTASISVLNMVQLILINGGLLAGSLLCVHMVVNGEGLTVGDYVLFTSYLLQLYAPLNYFGTYYRMLQKCFIDMENMLDLFKESKEVKDEPNAAPLQLANGTVEFRDVSFSYIEGKEVLKNVSFTVPGGKSVALVGSSGGGKTSIIRLLFRFYDPSAGEILIDNQNIQKITQKSLRMAVGVVPQDTVLFNDTIRQNILYGRIGSSSEEVEEAATAACIHDKILAFPDGYESIVGERGLKLSGGEKQRVAIARTLLKNPALILLDEATSALDTHTERQIQTSLNQLCTNRTSIIVAHRLSTIVNVNQILVLKEGTIAERGTHGELMAKGGLYAEMWNEQLRSSRMTEDLNENEGVLNNLTNSSAN